MHPDLDNDREQRLEAVARLAGKVAHDFNNLLTAISGYAQLLKAELPPDSPLLSDVEEITKAASRAATLTKQLLTFSGKRVLSLDACDLNSFVTSMAPRLHGLLGPAITLERRLQDGLPAVLADVAQLDQAVSSLVTNAAEAMPNGGTLTISTLPETSSAGVVTGVVLSLADTGVGIEPALMARSFEPFITTKDGDKSAGLGLAMAHGIVTQSGGTIALDSTRGHGTTVRITLPVAR